jgi:hypothetical protein
MIFSCHPVNGTKIIRYFDFNAVVKLIVEMIYTKKYKGPWKDSVDAQL